jgi:ABC-type transport system involved in multi-copper enzyme maturation permease subunit
MAWSFRDVRAPSGPSWVGATVLHATLHLRRLLDLRTLWPWLLLLAALVAASLGLVRLALADPSAIVEFFRKFALRGEALVALGLGTAAVRGEADAGAIGYWLLRPRAHVALPLGRWLAVVLATAAFGLLMTLGTLATTWGTILQPPSETVARMLIAAGLAALVYPAVFVWIGSTFKSAAAAGLAWLVAGDLAGALVSDSLRAISPAHHLGIVVVGSADRTLTDQLVDQVRTMAGKAAAQLPEAGWGPTLGAIGALAALTAVALGLALWRFRRDPPASAQAP